MGLLKEQRKEWLGIRKAKIDLYLQNTNQMDDAIEKLRKLWYNPETGFVGQDATWKLVKERKIPLTRKQVVEWYKKQQSNQTFTKPKTSKSDWIKIQCRPQNICLQIDLMEIQKSVVIKNQNKRYIFNCIDISSRYAWSAAIANKQPKTILPHLKKIIKETKKLYPEFKITVSSDYGSEFLGVVKQYLKNEGVEQVLSVYKNNTAVIERYNQSLWKVIRKIPDLKFVQHLPSIVKGYNSREHSSTQKKPVDIWQQKESRPDMTPVNPRAYNQFEVGDRVRFLRARDTFEKKSLANPWSTTIHTVEEQIMATNRYRISDHSGEFLARELLAVGEVETAEDQEIVDLERKVLKKIAKKDRKMNIIKKELDIVDNQKKVAKREIKKPVKFKDYVV